jgi:hypothetical protein
LIDFREVLGMNNNVLCKVVFLGRSYLISEVMLMKTVEWYYVNIDNKLYVCMYLTFTGTDEEAMSLTSKFH